MDTKREIWAKKTEKERSWQKNEKKRDLGKKGEKEISGQKRRKRKQRMRTCVNAYLWRTKIAFPHFPEVKSEHCTEDAHFPRRNRRIVHKMWIAGHAHTYIGEQNSLQR